VDLDSFFFFFLDSFHVLTKDSVAFVSVYKAVHVKLEEQIKDVDVAQSKEVHLFWTGMAEVSMQFIYLRFFFPNENGVSFVLAYLILLILIWTTSIQDKG
jgi:hypothetical protein